MRTETELAEFERTHRREIWESEAIDGDTNVCEGCWHCDFPGIRWPASPDGYQDLSYVDRCDYCKRYESDEDAAKFLSDHFNVGWGYAYRESLPKTDDDLRWSPAEDDDLDYTGWSCFIVRPERDGIASPLRRSS